MGGPGAHARVRLRRHDRSSWEQLRRGDSPAKVPRISPGPLGSSRTPAHGIFTTASGGFPNPAPWHKAHPEQSRAYHRQAGDFRSIRFSQNPGPAEHAASAPARTQRWDGSSKPGTWKVPRSQPTARPTCCPPVGARPARRPTRPPSLASRRSRYRRSQPHGSSELSSLLSPLSPPVDHYGRSSSSTLAACVGWIPHLSMRSGR